MSVCRTNRGISLVEIMMALAVLSTLALPMGLFFVEYVRGGSRLGDHYQVLTHVEQRLEMALVLPFEMLPEGNTFDTVITDSKGRQLDLRPVEVSNNLVSFSMSTEVIPIDFAALEDAFSGRLKRARVEEGMKRIEILAEWGEGGRHSISLLGYRANL